MGFENDKFYGEGICIQLADESSNQFHVYIAVFKKNTIIENIGVCFIQM